VLDLGGEKKKRKGKRGGKRRKTKGGTGAQKDVDRWVAVPVIPFQEDLFPPVRSDACHLTYWGGGKKKKGRRKKKKKEKGKKKRGQEVRLHR